MLRQPLFCSCRISASTGTSNLAAATFCEKRTRAADGFAPCRIFCSRLLLQRVTRASSPAHRTFVLASAASHLFANWYKTSGRFLYNWRGSSPSPLLPPPITSPSRGIKIAFYTIGFVGKCLARHSFFIPAARRRCLCGKGRRSSRLRLLPRRFASLPCRLGKLRICCWLLSRQPQGQPPCAACAAPRAAALAALFAHPLGARYNKGTNRLRGSCLCCGSFNSCTTASRRRFQRRGCRLRGCLVGRGHPKKRGLTAHLLRRSARHGFCHAPPTPCGRRCFRKDACAPLLYTREHARALRKIAPH